MVSSCRRKVRRYLLGATLKATRCWWIGQVTVRVMSVRAELSTRTVREKATHGAEKSCHTRRRKRGLRSNSHRSRSRRSGKGAASVSKDPSERKVNHQGRKFLWAVRAANRLRAECEQYNKLSRKVREGRYLVTEERSMKQHCMAKWTRLHMQAEASGIPPVAAFHRSFRDFLLTETTRVPNTHPMWEDQWDGLLSRLPRQKEEPSVFHHSGGVSRVVTRRKPGFAEINGEWKRACRACGRVFRVGQEDDCCNTDHLKRFSGVPPSRQRGSRGRRGGRPRSNLRGN